MPQTFLPSRPALAQALLPSHGVFLENQGSLFVSPENQNYDVWRYKKGAYCKPSGSCLGTYDKDYNVAGSGSRTPMIENGQRALFLGQCSWVPYACDVNIPWVNALIGNVNQTTSDLPEHKEGQDSPPFPSSVWSSWLGLPGIPGASLQCFVAGLRDPVENRTSNPFLGSSLISF